MATNYDLVSSSMSSNGSSSSDGGDGGDGGPNKKIDLSYQGLDADLLEVNLSVVTSSREEAGEAHVERILLYNNRLVSLSPTLLLFRNLSELDLSNNAICTLPDTLGSMVNLTRLFLRNNLIGDHGFPKSLAGLTKLRDLNLSGNRLTLLPHQLYDIPSLRNLFLGGNRITEIAGDIKRLRRLRVFYLGGNLLRTLPPEICRLENLHALILCDNKLESLPDCICLLHKLESLQLHQNRLTILPPGLIDLSSLSELSLRDNPLVVRFVREMTFQPSSLLELTARVMITKQITYMPDDLPASLQSYLRSSHHCVNPACRGVYFNSRVEHVKFVDFCGKYKIPLMQYLCSPRCEADKPAVTGGARGHGGIGAHCPTSESDIMRRVLLG